MAYIASFFITIAVVLATSSTIGCSHFRSLTAANRRLVNVRLVDIHFRLGLIEQFVSNHLGSKPVIVILGDSQAYGIGQHEGRIFSTQLQNALPGKTILNLSVIDVRIQDQMAILHTLERRKIKLETILLTFNAAHVNDYGLRRLTDYSMPAWLYFANPSSISLIRKMGLATDLPEKNDLPFAVRTKENNRFAFTAFKLDAMKTDLSSMLDAARRCARHVILYAPPHAIEGFAAYGYRPEQYRILVATLLGAGRNVRDVECLDLSESMPLAAFQDIVHFNWTGHKMAADTLLPLLSGGFPPVASPHSPGFSP